MSGSSKKPAFDPTFPTRNPTFASAFEQKVQKAGYAKQPFRFYPIRQHGQRGHHFRTRRLEEKFLISVI
jgi:hypothetical protein